MKHEIEEAETKLKAFGASRPVAVIEEALRGLEQDRRWQSSKSCEAATADASRSFCKGHFELKAEAARASEAGRLEERIAGLKSESRRFVRGRGVIIEAGALKDVLERKLLHAPVKQIAASAPRRVPRVSRD